MPNSKVMKTRHSAASMRNKPLPTGCSKTGQIWPAIAVPTPTEVTNDGAEGCERPRGGRRVGHERQGYVGAPLVRRRSHGKIADGIRQSQAPVRGAPARALHH